MVAAREPCPYKIRILHFSFFKVNGIMSYNPFVGSLSNHERPFDKLRANGRRMKRAATFGLLKSS